MAPCPRDDEFALWLRLLDMRATPELLDQVGDFLTSYLASSGLRCYVLGLSGGLDSSFLAALMHQRGIPYLGFCLPVDSNTPEEMARAIAVSQAYATGQVDDLTPLYRQISKSFLAIAQSSNPVAEGNLKARLRMMFLYHMAQIHGGCVLGTDQLDELLTGFWTLHGDVGDVCPLQLIPKSVEYDLARMLCTRLADPAPLQAAIEAVPTDGLGISRSDLEQLGAESYAQVEDVFRAYFRLRLQEKTAGLTLAEQDERARLEKSGPVRRFLNSAFKRSGFALMTPKGFEDSA